MAYFMVFNFLTVVHNYVNIIYKDSNFFKFCLQIMIFKYIKIIANHILDKIKISLGF